MQKLLPVLLSSQKFPTDRTVFFSDAVFAIAMTLLILEIKVPSVEEVNASGIGGVLVKRIPGFIAFTVSFIVTALFWKAHLQLCQSVKTVTSRFIWINIFLLFFVVLMPFSTALYSMYFGLDSAFAVYSVNVAAIGFMSYILTRHVIHVEKLATTEDAVAVRWMKRRSLIVPMVFLACIPIGMLSPWAGRFGFFLIFVMQAIGDRRLKKKMHAALQPVVQESQKEQGSL